MCSTSIAGIRDRLGIQISNVFHAGDGNLHPCISFDRRQPGLTAKVEEASREIMRVCLEAGGSITGEHGVGSDKMDYMPWAFSAGVARSDVRGAPGLRSRDPGQSWQGLPRAHLPGVAAGRSRMSEALYTRLTGAARTRRRRA